MTETLSPVMLRTLGVAVALLLSPAACSPQACRSPEVVDGASRYNQLVCAGIEAEAAGDYRGAAEALESALQVPLLEYPNYRPLPRLALALAMAGDTVNASRVLDEARLALEVVFGRTRCVYEGEQFVLRPAIAPGALDVTGTAEAATVRRMCGEAYNPHYERPLLDLLRIDRELIDLYLAADQRIRGRSKG